MILAVHLSRHVPQSWFTEQFSSTSRFTTPKMVDHGFTKISLPPHQPTTVSASPRNTHIIWTLKQLPWVPETFLAWFPVSVFAACGFNLRLKMCWLTARTKNSRHMREKPLVPWVLSSILSAKNNLSTTGIKDERHRQHHKAALYFQSFSKNSSYVEQGDNKFKIIVICWKYSVHAISVYPRMIIHREKKLNFVMYKSRETGVGRRCFRFGQDSSKK